MLSKALQSSLHWLVTSPAQKPAGRGVGPDFLCIGMPKAGTSWLYAQMVSHEDFWMPPVKELHYFDNPLIFSKYVDSPKIWSAILKKNINSSLIKTFMERNGRWPPDERDWQFIETAQTIAGSPDVNPDYYAALFDQKNGKLSGDITPNYSELPETIIASIARRFPALKVIYIIRDPVENFWSHLCMSMRVNKLREEDISCLDTVKKVATELMVAKRMYPSKVVARWKQYIPDENFGIFFFDDLYWNEKKFRENVFRFLSADPDKPSDAPGTINCNQDKKKLTMPESVQSYLASCFKQEIITCANKFGGAAETWPERYGL